MYDIFSDNIYPINSMKLYYRLVDCHYRFVTDEIKQWIENKKALNTVEVRILQERGMPNLFIFRGVREKYYDKLQKKHAKHIGFKYSGGAVEIL